MANESVEVSAKSVDEAIDEALEELGLKRQQVEIEILTAGKPGLFGIGGEQARVRVTALEEGTARPMAEPDVEDTARPMAEPEEEDTARPMAKPAMEGEEPPEIEIKDVASPEVDLASDHLSQLLAFMEIDGEVSVRAPETPGDGLGRASAVLDVDGDDLGLLIGRRGTTLAALQYIINLMVSRKMGSRVLISLDIEHYRRRREDSLTGLAQRMADRVRKSGRSLTLEPMPAGERRIVHLALAEDSAVTTGSVGEGDGRKVVIYPQRGRPGER
ncbi:MAG: protein jag [Chloroflexi bacterium]|nr:protein jag [Chloroflexota bacterium]